MNLLIQTDNCYTLSALASAFGVRPSAMYVLLAKKNGPLDPFVKEVTINGCRFFVLIKPIPESVFRLICSDSSIEPIPYHAWKNGNQG